MLYLFVLFSIAYFAQGEFSLPRIIWHLGTRANQNQSNKALCEQYSLYRNVSIDACNAIKHNRTVPDHVWYRAELARVISLCGMENFCEHIAPYLTDWDTLKRIKNVTPNNFQNPWQLVGTSIYCEEDGYLIFKTQQGVLVDSGLESTLFGNGDDIRKYYSLATLFGTNSKTLCCSDQLLLDPITEGILFCNRFYYGSINYTTQKALVYDCSAGSKDKIDFSKMVPWDILKTGGYGWASIFFDQDRFYLTFFDFRMSQKPEWQIAYQIKSRIDHPSQFARPENYISNEQIRWIDRSSNFPRYSHAWFSFLFFKFLVGDSRRKLVRAKSFVERTIGHLHWAVGIMVYVVSAAFGANVTLALLFGEPRPGNRLLIAGAFALFLASAFIRGSILFGIL